LRGMGNKGICWLLIVLLWSGHAKRCKNPKGSAGDLAKCHNGRWKRDWTLQKIHDTVVENGEKLDELKAADQQCAKVVFGDWYTPDTKPIDAYVPYHVVTNEDDMICSFRLFTNFWLTDVGKTGNEASLYMAFNCPRKIKGFKVKNTHNGDLLNRGTKDFNISILHENPEGITEETNETWTGLEAPWKDWPWKDVFTGQLPEARPPNVPVLNFELDEPTVETQFLRFQITSYWGVGGGLQYFYPY